MEKKESETEFWSIKEKRTYTINNTRRIKIGTVWILATPAGEPLVVKIR